MGVWELHMPENKEQDTQQNTNVTAWPSAFRVQYKNLKAVRRLFGCKLTFCYYDYMLHHNGITK